MEELVRGLVNQLSALCYDSVSVRPSVRHKPMF